MKPVRVEYEFHIRTAAKGRKCLAEGHKPQPKPKPPKVSSTARTLALAHHFDRLLESGQACDYADIARRLGISRARVTQVMNALLLPVGEQERVLLQVDQQCRPGGAPHG